MSLTNHQLRSFARHIDEGTLNENTRHATRAYLNMGLLDDEGNLTPAGRDALATVPHLIDPEPPKPVEPETRECDACEGAGARYVARVCPLTLHERTVFVQCEAPGCERGRVAERVARPVIDVDPGYRPVISVKTSALTASAFAFVEGPMFKLNEPVTDDRRRALLDYAVESRSTAAACCINTREFYVGIPRTPSYGVVHIDARCVRVRSSIEHMIMLVAPGTTPEGARAIAWDAGWCPKLGWANDAEKQAPRSVHDEETLALAATSNALNVEGDTIRLNFGKHYGSLLVHVPAAYVNWASQFLAWTKAKSVFWHERERRVREGTWSL